MSLTMDNVADIKVEMVPVEDISISKIKIRDKQGDHDKFRSLVLSVSQRGVLEAVKVRPAIDPETGKVIPGKYELIDGLQRTEACKEAGRTHIPARILTCSDEELMGHQAILNRIRVPQTKAQELAQLKQILSMHPEYTTKDLCELFDYSPAELSMIFKLDELVPEALELAKSGQLPQVKALELARLPESLQTPEMIKHALNENTAEFAARCKKAKSNFKKEQAGLQPDTGPDFKARKRAEVEERLAAVVHATETLDAGTPEHTAALHWKAAFEWYFQVDAESLAQREAVKKAKSANTDLQKAEEKMKKMREEEAALRKQIAEAKKELESTAGMQV